MLPTLAKLHGLLPARATNPADGDADAPLFAAPPQIMEREQERYLPAIGEPSDEGKGGKKKTVTNNKLSCGWPSCNCDCLSCC